jgi:hypothetical protein
MARPVVGYPQLTPMLGARLSKVDQPLNCPLEPISLPYQLLNPLSASLQRGAEKRRDYFLVSVCASASLQQRTVACITFIAAPLSRSEQ